MTLTARRESLRVWELSFSRRSVLDLLSIAAVEPTSIDAASYVASSTYDRVQPPPGCPSVPSLDGADEARVVDGVASRLLT